MRETATEVRVRGQGKKLKDIGEHPLGREKADKADQKDREKESAGCGGAAVHVRRSARNYLETR